jgi:chromosome partitioning protein
MQCEYYAREGLSVILQLVERMRATGANPSLRVEGIAMTMYSRTRLADEVVAQVRDHYADAVYKTVIPRSVRAGEAPSYGIPLVAYAPNAPVAQAYFALAAEFLAREKARAAAAKAADGKGDFPLPSPDSSRA